ncbi:mechanosensitive ion channel family protein [Pseudohoeflea suaedae]|uniref:Mechanosensitive ion channel family protein n=1 Tax=Pseudohoeflea suaedae TaxID=877384 RepID=A0A4R5PHM0_9HYPH|nr:mechanosensitive ion channel domain-containing protein [Pseudohoeflea suaedae]TDH34322.1 mechanosensitive ion channel family protein [Pseudohoeflea suaedae]
MGAIDLKDIITEWRQAGFSIWQYLSQPWTLYQLLIIFGCFLIGWLLSRKIEPALEERARQIKGNPGLLRVIIAFMRRTEWVLFILFVGFAREVLLRATWPSRTYLLSLALVLAVTWLAASVLTRIVRNRFLAKFISVCLFVYVASGVLGIRDELQSTLDDLAINLGEFRLSVLFVLKAIVLLVLLLWAAHLAGRFVESRLSNSTDLSPSFKALAGKVVNITLAVAAGLIALNLVGVDLTTLTVLSGAIGVGLGFGLQKVVSNFISGVIILADRSIKPGDTITLGDTFGWIRELRARFVSVITRDGREYLIPNEDFITQQVVNWSFSDKNIRLDVDFGVSYDSDPHEVMRIAIEATAAVDRVLTTPKPVCWMTAFGASSLDFKLRFWIQDPQAGLTNIRGKVLLALWDAFREAGINIPFPHREVLMRTPVEIVRKTPDSDSDQAKIK